MKGVGSGVVKFGLGATVLLIVAVVVIAEVQWSVEDAGGGAPLVQSDPAGLYDMDPWFRRLWVRGCVASGEGATFCRCAIKEYTTRLAPWEFETASVVFYSGGQLAELPEHVRAVVKDVKRKCR